jgi:hypothetical protein
MNPVRCSQIPTQCWSTTREHKKEVIAGIVGAILAITGLLLFAFGSGALVTTGYALIPLGVSSMLLSLFSAWCCSIKAPTKEVAPAKFIKAVCEGSEEEVLGFLQQDKDIVNRESSAGTTPLQDAILNQQTKMVKLLVNNGADVNKWGTKFTVSPLFSATCSTQYEAAEILVKSGANTKEALGYAKNMKDARMIGILSSASQS